jgi:hypothetical protein
MIASRAAFEPSIETPAGYINMASKMKRATDDVFVPEVSNYG